MKHINLVLLALLVGCGQNPVSSQQTPNVSYSYLPESSCVVKDSCTYVNVVGYRCQSLLLYQGSNCTIYKEDFQTDPACDPLNPAGCQTVQGPGPAS